MRLQYIVFEFISGVKMVMMKLIAVKETGKGKTV